LVFIPTLYHEPSSTRDSRLLRLRYVNQDQIYVIVVT
jgi:hypothetical protein